MSRFDVFLSYHWRDHAAVEALARRLTDAGLSVFLDRWYLTPGANWLRELEQRLANCQSVAVCVGAEQGPWQAREQYAALDRQAAAEKSGQSFPVIPVLLPGSEPPLGFLRQNTWVDLRPALDDAAALATLVKAIGGESPGPDVLAAPAARAQICPYRGLLYFRESDRDFFFGRDAAVAELAAMLERKSLVALVGASGAGKSSVVRAGLIPHLRGQPSPVWEFATLKPGDQPFRALASALLPLLEPDQGEVERLRDIGGLAEDLSQGATTLRDVVNRVLEKQPGSERLLLVIDQWEELFTLTADETSRRRFIGQLLDATEKCPLRAVLTLRGDFFGRAVTSVRELCDRLQGAQVNLGPMNEAELRAAIEAPAQLVGLRFEPGLVDGLLADVGDEPGNLPLLEFVLQVLWDNRQGSQLHKDAHAAMGKLKGAIAKKADALYNTLQPNDQAALHRVFLRLVRPGEGEQDTRRRANLADFEAAAVRLIAKLCDERLLVTSGNGDGAAVEVAHEALIQHWQVLRDWVNADRQFMLWQQDASAAAARWINAKRSGDLLWRGLPLAQAKAWAGKKPDDLSANEQAFIKAGLQRRWRNRLLGASVGAVVVAAEGYLFVQAIDERQRADFARAKAEELVNFMTFELRDKLQPIGRLDLMEGVNAKVAAYYQQIGERGGNDQSEHQRAASFATQGNTLLAQGQLDAALKGYQQALAISEALAARDPANTQWQRDLSVSHEKIGDVRVAQGDGPGALAAYRKFLAIAEALAARDPANTEWQRDLSISHNKIGDVLVAQGDGPGALAEYRKDLAIAEALAARDPANTEWQRDLFVSHVKIGDVLVAQGDGPGALAEYRKGLAIAEALAARDPANTQWQRDLSVSHEKIGDVLVAQGDGPGALAEYRKSLTIREALAARDPANTEWQRDLAVSYWKIGTVSEQLKQPAEARAYLERMQAISARLAKLDPSNAQWQKDLQWVEAKLKALRSAKP